VTSLLLYLVYGNGAAISDHIEPFHRFVRRARMGRCVAVETCCQLANRLESASNLFKYIEQATTTYHVCERVVDVIAMVIIINY
jgi:hypothetical protein